MQVAYKNIEKNNTSRKCNVVMVFDDMIADMISNKAHSQIVSIVTGLLIEL